MTDRDHASHAPVRIALVGATGLIGRRCIAISSESDAARIVGIARREMELPAGSRCEMFVAQTDKWGEVLEAVQPPTLICALGTTWKKAGRDEEAFRAVDQRLVVEVAQAAHDAKVSNLVLISAAGANAASKTFYARVKGEVEREVSNIGFKRLDILRPGLLKGPRNNDRRIAERLGIVFAPLIEPLLPAKYAGLHSIDADLVAQAALGLALRRAAGKFVHDNDAMKRAAREWRNRVEPAQGD
ncbi:MAG: NAD(P)H-binding protein [Erythrobacter sp.]|uniref:NAD(P)H-binding protein n=1 Tax=Erythrobacter sp. TaxID=1042 RepID=UPI003C785607